MNAPRPSAVADIGLGFLATIGAYALCVTAIAALTGSGEVA